MVCSCEDRNDIENDFDGMCLLPNISPSKHVISSLMSDAHTYWLIIVETED